MEGAHTHEFELSGLPYTFPDTFTFWQNLPSD